MSNIFWYIVCITKINPLLRLFIPESEWHFSSFPSELFFSYFEFSIFQDNKKTNIFRKRYSSRRLQFIFLTKKKFMRIFFSNLSPFIQIKIGKFIISIEKSTKNSNNNVVTNGFIFSDSHRFYEDLMLSQGCMLHTFSIWFFLFLHFRLLMICRHLLIM